MNKSPNKIKLNNDLWFTFLNNKVIFGNSEKRQSHHHTISYGNNSGHFDLHLKNEKTGKYFTVFKISHLNLLEILPQFLNKIFISFLNLKKIEKSLIGEKGLEIFEINNFGDLTDKFALLTKKNRVVINQSSEEFKEFADLLIKKYKTNKSDLTEIAEKNQFQGIAKLRSEYYFLIKSPYLGPEIYILNDIDFCIESVLSKILGKDTYEQIIERINQGIIELEK